MLSRVIGTTARRSFGLQHKMKSWSVQSFCSSNESSKWGLPYDEDHIRNMPLEELKDALTSGSNKVSHPQIHPHTTHILKI